MNAHNFNRLVSAVLSAQAKLEALPWSPESSAEHDAAKDALEAAREALKSAIETAPWGQCGAVFITDRAAGIGYRECRILTLHINGRIRAVVDGSRVDVVSADQAELRYRNERIARRAQEELYARKREQLIDDMRSYLHNELAGFGDWRYEDGQHGGVFVHTGGTRISANGALRGAWGVCWYKNRHNSKYNTQWEALAQQAERRYYGARY